MQSKLIKNTMIITGCSIAAKLLSYIWEAILAALLGVSDQADAVYLTTSLFTVIYPILDLGIWKVFLPIYKTKIVQQTSKEADSFANKSITIFSAISLILVVFLIVLAVPLTLIVAPGFDEEKRTLAAFYLRLSAPGYFLMAVSSIIGAVLQCHDRFLGSQIREIGTHVSKIIYILFFYKYLGIYAAVTATIVGSVFRLLVQLPFVNWKWKFKLDFRFKDSNVKTMLKGLPSVSLTAAIAHINTLVNQMIASAAGSGAISCMNYGQKLLNLFSGMISLAIGTATYPTIIQYIAEERTDKVKSLLYSTINVLSFLIVPISLFCMLFSSEIVEVAFQRGSFDAEATRMTAGVFTGYSLGMLFTAIATIVVNVFYAYGDTKLTLKISGFQIVINLLLNLLFYKVWGIAGLALATSVTAMICLLVRFVFLKKFIKIDHRVLLTETGKITVASLLSVGSVFVLFKYFISASAFVRVVLSVTVAAVMYFVLAHIFRIQTMKVAVGMIRKKIKK